MNTLNGLITVMTRRQIPSLGRVELQFSTELPALGISPEEPLAPPEAPRKARRPAGKKAPVPELPKVEPKAPAPEPPAPATMPKPVPPIAARKREPVKKVVAEEDVPAVREAPKPLKVVRRRGAEPLKVFRTEPRLVPEAMLVGVAPAQEESES
ncbi:MAG: hypothetical protein FJ118_05165 [Deltaproteobacteria bacterium]|nr:hypothetical protein [Deltaproteobacteria bacterium]